MPEAPSSHGPRMRVHACRRASTATSSSGFRAVFLGPRVQADGGAGPSHVFMSGIGPVRGAILGDVEQLRARAAPARAATLQPVALSKVVNGLRVFLPAETLCQPRHGPLP